MRITHANGVATLALVLAAGGAYAAASSAIGRAQGHRCLAGHVY